MWFYRHLLQVADNSIEGITNGNSSFPPDLFTIEQLKNGAIILPIIGIVAKC